MKDIGKDYVSVEWNPPKSDGGAKITNYHLLVKEEGSDEWKEVAKVGPLDSSFTFKGLSDKKKYVFAVVAENKVGQSQRLETDSAVKPKKPAGEFLHDYVLCLWLWLRTDFLALGTNL